MIKITQVCPELFCAKNRSTFFAVFFLPSFSQNQNRPTDEAQVQAFIFIWRPSVVLFFGFDYGVIGE
jgi:hypothetical protein